MARNTPKLSDDVLRLYERGTWLPILNIRDARAWEEWLDQAVLFAYESAVGSFTATKENRANGKFWYATRRIRGKQRTIYLGRSADLSPEKLEQAARELANLTSYEFEGQRWRSLVGVLKQAGLQLDEDRYGRWTWAWPEFNLLSDGQTGLAPVDISHSSPEDAIINALDRLLFEHLNVQRHEEKSNSHL